MIYEHSPESRLGRLVLVFLSGSSQESIEERGLTFFSARGLLRGTKNYSYEALMTQLERLGADIDVEVDAGRVFFEIDFLDKNTERVVELLGDLFFTPAFREADLQTLSKTMLGEIEVAYEDPQNLAAFGLLKLVFSESPLGYPDIGTFKALSRLDYTQAKRSFDLWSHSKLVVGYAGPKTEKKMTELLAPFHSLSLSSQIRLPEIRPAKKGRCSAVVGAKGLSTVPFYLACAGMGDGHPEAAEVELANFILGGDYTSRLMTELRVKNGWTYGVSSGFQQIFSPQRVPTLFSIYSFPDPLHAGEAIQKTIEIFEDFVKQGVTEDELNYARDALLKRAPFSQTSAAKRLLRRVREVTSGRPCFTLEELTRRFSQLTQKSLNQLIARHFHLDHLFLVNVGEPEMLLRVNETLPGFRKPSETLVVTSN